jgi:hypothetical protein
MSQTVLFIHGGWVTPSCWDPFGSFFEASGYRCLAPAWPSKDRSVEAIRADPSPLAGLGIGEIVDHYDRIVRELDEPPILIGHSFGGLFVQLLLDRGLGAAGVAIDSAPPKGVFVFDPTSLLSVGRILLIPFGWRKVVRWTFTEFRYAFVPLRLRPHDAARRGTGDLGGPGRARFGPPLLPERVLDVRFREPGPGRLREPESGAPPADRRGGGPRHDARHRPPDLPRLPGLARPDRALHVPRPDPLAHRPGRLGGSGPRLPRLDWAASGRAHHHHAVSEVQVP